MWKKKKKHCCCVRHRPSANGANGANSAIVASSENGGKIAETSLLR